VPSLGLTGATRLGRLPTSVWAILREAARHLLRRPVVAVVAVARVPDGRWLLVRRGDFGNWSLAGGTLEWGETLLQALEREIAEEAGVDLVRVGRLLGVFSRPDRDPRFHSVTVLVECDVTEPRKPPANPLEILEVGLFTDAGLPSDIAFGGRDAIDAAHGAGSPIFE
jgi:8-oxo-dGTP diphosphatase